MSEEELEGALRRYFDQPHIKKQIDDAVKNIIIYGQLDPSKCGCLTGCCGIKEKE